MAENERSFPRTVALISLAGTLGAAVIGGLFTLTANHGSPQPQPSATSPAPPPVSSSAAGPATTDSVVATRTPDTGSSTPAVTQPAAGAAAVSGVPRQITESIQGTGQQLTLHGSGFPKNGAIRITFATYPGEDYQMATAQADSQGSFTVTVSSMLLSTVCGYDGRLNTWDDSGGGPLTSNPLTVTC